MSDWGWLGILVSAFVTTLALASYVVMALPYFDDAPFLTDLRFQSRKAMVIGTAVFAVFLGIFYLGGIYLDQNTSGPLLLFAAFVIGLPISLLLGSETWDRRNGHGMNRLPGARAVAVATGIGLAEMIGFSLAFMAMLQVV